MKTFHKNLFLSVSMIISAYAYSQDARLENILNKNQIAFQYDSESLRYFIGFRLNNQRAQLVKIDAFHTKGDIKDMRIYTMVRSEKINGKDLENWVLEKNKKVKKGNYNYKRDVVFFEITIPVKSSDKAILDAIRTVAEEGDKAEKELASGDEY